MYVSAEQQYLKLLAKIVEHGENRDKERTGTGTRAIFGERIVIDLETEFPLLTTKRVPFKSVETELRWFLEGSGDERRLAEMLHGTRDPEKKTIWSPNASGTTGAKFKPAFAGDLGRVYGVQWRSWETIEVLSATDPIDHLNGTLTYNYAKIQIKHIDQIAEAIDKLRNNPADRRIIVTAWNPGELDKMALPPCHMFMQFYLSNDNKLSCMMHQRSVDVFLGLPFNMASYALLVRMMCATIGATPGTLTMDLGDTHIYNDHTEQVKEQLSRTPTEPPKLLLKKTAYEYITDIKGDDIVLLDYNPAEAIKAKMSA